MVNVRRLLTAVMRAHTHLAEVPMHCQVEEAVPLKMIGDAMRLQQILANGLVNATKVRRCLTALFQGAQIALPFGGSSRGGGPGIHGFWPRDSWVFLSHDMRMALLQPRVCMLRGAVSSI